jgi:hypothetical protein
MLLVDKYEVKDDYFIHADIIAHIDETIIDNTMQHIIIHGPSGGGKRTIGDYILKKLYGAEAKNIKQIHLPLKCLVNRLLFQLL